MSNAIQISNAIEAALIQCDLKGLSPEQRISYYKSVCESVGLNPLTKPFDYITLNGKLTLYAKRDATDQLRKVRSVSITIPARELHGDVYVVTARAKDKDGREDESTGAVCIAGLKGEALANAYMKAETKAKRRVTLSVCGLGLLDESEVDSIPDAKPDPIQTAANVVPLNAIQDFSEELVDSSESMEELRARLGSYVIPFGKKFNGKRLEQCDRYELASWVDYIKKSAQQKGKELDGDAKVAIDNADAYIATFEFERK